MALPTELAQISTSFRHTLLPSLISHILHSLLQVFQQSDTAASRALQPFYAIINVIVVVVVVVVGIFCPAPGRARPQLPLLGLASSAHLCQLAHCCVSPPPPSPSLSLAASACAAAAVRAYYWCAENVCVIAMLTFVFFAHLSTRQAGRYERGQAGEGRVLAVLGHAHCRPFSFRLSFVLVALRGDSANPQSKCIY